MILATNDPRVKIASCGCLVDGMDCLIATVCQAHTAAMSDALQKALALNDLKPRPEHMETSPIHVHVWIYNVLTNAMHCRTCMDRIECDYRLPRAIELAYTLAERRPVRTK